MFQALDQLGNGSIDGAGYTDFFADAGHAAVD
jgi:hypothetical protein